MTGLALACIAAQSASAQTEGRVIDPKIHHLGDNKMDDWKESTPAPEGTRLDVKFDAKANSTELTLSVRQRSVEDDWFIELNGQRVLQLRRRSNLTTQFYPIPPGALRDGENTLIVVGKDPRDDMAVGEFSFIDSPIRDFLRLVPVRVRVKDEATGKPLPVRITIAGADAKRLDVYFAEAEQTAVRTGVVYTRDGEVLFEVPEGDYSVYATRGVEWSLAKAPLAARRGQTHQLDLSIRRELDTAGRIACDTHLHTFEISKHGDATIDERVISIAAEGVELAVATDHNHHLDYTPHQTRLKLNSHFTPVVGNEVTTANGHFNAFPLDPKTPPPNQKETNWVKLVSSIREAGAKVVILNHPRWPSIPRSPLTVFGMNRGSGERPNGPEFTFDALELINSTAVVKDPHYVLLDWFALMNHGEKILAVGTSDTHSVFDPPGQGRTYVRSSTDAPAKIDVDAACREIRAGNISVSMGIIADVRVNKRFTMGQIAPVADSKVEVELRVQAPSWAEPRSATVFLNGIAAAVMDVPRQPGEPTDARLRFIIPAPAHDAHLVCFVEGPGITEPCWPTYSTYTFAATNPVYVDADGDSRYSPPRETAKRLVAGLKPEPDALETAMRTADDAIAVQMLALARVQFPNDALPKLEEMLARWASAKPLFQLYKTHLPTPAAASQ